MISTCRDLTSVVEELKVLCKQILEVENNDLSLTSIQWQMSRDQLKKDTEERGISFSISRSDNFGLNDYSNIHFTWQPPIAVKGTGTITDVSAVGANPIRISAAQDVSVCFEPRDLRKMSDVQSLSNSEFAGLKKGDLYEFRGVIVAQYYFKQAPCRFDIFIANEINRESEGKSEGCFVATAAYGSLSPTVFLLREYRDCVLDEAALGRAAVQLYYKLSPPLARFIQDSPRRRRIARALLRPVSFLARLHLESFRKMP